MISKQDGSYTPTEAYNFLKGLLGVRKNVLINKQFFLLFFTKVDDFYIIKKSENIIKDIFTKGGIAELNKVYYQKKKAKEISAAKKIAEQVTSLIQESLAA